MHTCTHTDVHVKNAPTPTNTHTTLTARTHPHTPTHTRTILCTHTPIHPHTHTPKKHTHIYTHPYSVYKPANTHTRTHTHTAQQPITTSFAPWRGWELAARNIFDAKTKSKWEGGISRSCPRPSSPPSPLSVWRGSSFTRMLPSQCRSVGVFFFESMLWPAACWCPGIHP